MKKGHHIVIYRRHGVFTLGICRALKYRVYRLLPSTDFSIHNVLRTATIYLHVLCIYVNIENMHEIRKVFI